MSTNDTLRGQLLKQADEIAKAGHNGWGNTMREAAAALAERQGGEQTAAAHDVLAERKRQISAEGWTPEHDDEHASFEMADAAGCYAHSAAGWNTYSARDRWPWSLEWWKPTTPRGDLVKAGALILAEIERLDRAALAEPVSGGTEHDVLMLVAEAAEPDSEPAHAVEYSLLSERVKMLSLVHGGLRGVSRALGIDVGYLSRLASGEKQEPGDEIIAKLGLRRVVSYQDTTGRGEAMRSAESPAPVTSDEPPRCPKCGYTEKDCRELMDHHLCGEPDPAPACLTCGDSGWIGGEPCPDCNSAPALEVDEREAFEREDRYIVIKRKDLENVLRAEPANLANFCAVVDLQIALEKLSPVLPVREYLVIESGWPEYEPAWQMIEERVSGTVLSERQGGERDAGLELAAQWVEKRAADYDAEHGATDPETGTREYPGDGAEYVYELEEIAEGIRALSAIQQEKSE